MKTAEEVLAILFNTNSNMLDDSAHMRVSTCLEAMKDYANYKLDEASNLAESEIYYHPEDHGEPDSRVIKQSILCLKDAL